MSSEQSEPLTWEMMLQVGMGRMALSPSAFYTMTFDEFNAAVKGFNEREEFRERGEWERIRWLGTLTLQPHLRKGRKLKPKDLAVFPWEVEPKPKNYRKMSKQELFDEIQMRDGWQD